MLKGIENKVQAIYSDLDLIRDGNLYELKKAPGKPKCSTIASKIKDSLDEIVASYESIIEQNSVTEDRDEFNLLSGLLVKLYREISDLSKKHPNDLINIFKIEQINRVLSPLKNLMKDEPSAPYLDLVAEAENNADKSRNSYSDVAVIMSQYIEACEEYRAKHYSDWV